MDINNVLYKGSRWRYGAIRYYLSLRMMGSSSFISFSIEGSVEEGRFCRPSLILWLVSKNELGCYSSKKSWGWVSKDVNILMM